ncbi:MAG: hypothetical protein ABIR54_20815 [Burkholderiaceae bacterium]
MNRCAQLSLAFALAGTLATLAPGPANAQGTLQRNFPQNALRGKVVFGSPPAIRMNGVATHLSPGYRIHGQDNLIVMSAQLAGSTATVDYITDVEGHVVEIWILTPAEAAKRWPVAREQAAAWAFDPAAQTWTKP